MLIHKWWARPELNWRSLPCQGNVITPRPRALGNLSNNWTYISESVCSQDTIFEILPVQSF